MLKMFDLYRAAGSCRFLVLKRGMYCRKRIRRADGQREGVAMNTWQYKYEVVPYPKLRRVLEIMYPSVKRKPMIHGLLEVDVTRARAHLRDHKAKTGESLSFTAFIITCLARAVDESKSLHACRKGSKHLVLHDPEFRSRDHRRGSGSALHRAVERPDRKWLRPLRELARSPLNGPRRSGRQRAVGPL